MHASHTCQYLYQHGNRCSHHVRIFSYMWCHFNIRRKWFLQVSMNTFWINGKGTAKYLLWARLTRCGQIYPMVGKTREREGSSSGEPISLDEEGISSREPTSSDVLGTGSVGTGCWESGNICNLPAISNTSLQMQLCNGPVAHQFSLFWHGGNMGKHHSETHTLFNRQRGTFWRYDVCPHSVHLLAIQQEACLHLFLP